MAALTDIAKTGRKAESHRPWPRAIVGARRLAACHCRQLVEARATLLGLWGDKDAVHLALLEEPSGAIAVFTLECPDGKFPSVGAHHPAAIRLERTIGDLYGLKPIGAADTRHWLDLGFWGVTHPLGKRAQARDRSLPLRIPAGRRRGSAPDPGRPRPCRHHRARAFPLHRQRRGGGAARSSGSAMCIRASSG